MTREEAKKLLPIIQAFAEGKTIQYKNNYDTWRSVSNENSSMLFDKDPSKYRIKPEPKYRPFRTVKECWDEMHKHPDFGWVLCDGVYLHLLDVYCDATHTNEQQDGIDYDDALAQLTFTDGAPFGIKEE